MRLYYSLAIICNLLWIAQGSAGNSEPNTIQDGVIACIPFENDSGLFEPIKIKKSYEANDYVEFSADYLCASRRGNREDLKILNDINTIDCSTPWNDHGISVDEKSLKSVLDSDNDILTIRGRMWRDPKDTSKQGEIQIIDGFLLGWADTLSDEPVTELNLPLLIVKLEDSNPVNNKDTHITPAAESGLPVVGNCYDRSHVKNIVLSASETSEFEISFACNRADKLAVSDLNETFMIEGLRTKIVVTRHEMSRDGMVYTFSGYVAGKKKKLSKLANQGIHTIKYLPPFASGPVYMDFRFTSEKVDEKEEKSS